MRGDLSASDALSHAKGVHGDAVEHLADTDAALRAALVEEQLAREEIIRSGAADVGRERLRAASDAVERAQAAVFQGRLQVEVTRARLRQLGR